MDTSEKYAVLNYTLRALSHQQNKKEGQSLMR